MHRFYHHGDGPGAGEIILSRDESHHAMRVVRARQGDPVAVFNGAGTEWLGTIADLSRNEVRVAIESHRTETRPAPEVTLVQAWLHRDKLLDEIVRQGTVLGAAEILFFRADHSDKRPRLAGKWDRLCIEACKQCGRLWLPRIRVADDLDGALACVGGRRLVVARMAGPHMPIAGVAGEAPIAYVVGPEGDFSETELARLREADTMPVSLGNCTYRSEMAAQIGLTLIQHHLGHIGAV